MSNTSARPLTSLAIASALAFTLSATSSFAPSSAKRRQMAPPMAPPPPVTSTVFPERPFTRDCRLAFWSFVDDAFRLADRALDGVERHVPHVDADADGRLDRVLQPVDAFAFNQHREMVERPLLG